MFQSGPIGPHSSAIGSSAHRLLSGTWAGATEFGVSGGYIQDIDGKATKKNGKSIVWADLISDAEEFVPPRAGINSLCDAPPTHQKSSNCGGSSQSGLEEMPVPLGTCERPVRGFRQRRV